MEEGGGGGLTAHEIYVALTSGPGAGTLNAAHQASAMEARRQADRAERIERIARKIEAGWQGSAAEGAHGATAGVADVIRDRVDRLPLAEDSLRAQSGWFTMVAHSVRPVPPVPPQSHILNDMTPWETDLDREIKQYQDDAQHNLRLYGAYDDDSWSNQNRLPREYVTITDTGRDVSVKEPESPSGRPPSGGEFQPASGPESGGVPVQTGGGSPVGGDARPPQVTDLSDAAPLPTSPPGSRPPGNWQPPVSPPPGTGPGPIVGLPVAPVGGRGLDSGRGGSGSGGRGLRGGTGDGGPGARGTGGPGGRGAGEHGAGGRPGPGALAAEEAARRAGAGAGARGGAAGMGGAGALGAGRSPGGEDGEHERKYTIEPDPEELFGTDVLTAPPVLGEEEE